MLQTRAPVIVCHRAAGRRETSCNNPLCYAAALSPRLQIIIGERPLPDLATRRLLVAPPAATWPFRYPLLTAFPDEPAVVRVDDLHEAFVNRQTASTRLVTTQAIFLVQAWVDAIGARAITLIATADRAALEMHAPELLARRGLFREAVIEDLPDEAPAPAAAAPTGDVSPAMAMLASAMRVDDPRERLARCVKALDEERTAATLVATASVCMEVNDLEAAGRDLDDAVALAPDWAAVHFERGKLHLRRDDMDEASRSFQAAAERMPRFGSAWANLGATLGELDRPEEALAAFEHALACDPASHQTLNNIGVVSRELGRLGESEAAFRRVIALAPDLAFGYYNLGHTLFLEGRYQGALTAYVEGQKRDPERNAVQATRLAMCRLATGDASGAIAELEAATRTLPREYRQQVLADTQTIAWALLTHRPDLAGWTTVQTWLTQALAQS